VTYSVSEMRHVPSLQSPNQFGFDVAGAKQASIEARAVHTIARCSRGLLGAAFDVGDELRAAPAEHLRRRCDGVRARIGTLSW
jgi:hypothetical protein